MSFVLKCLFGPVLVAAGVLIAMMAFEFIDHASQAPVAGIAARGGQAAPNGQAAPPGPITPWATARLNLKVKILGRDPGASAIDAAPVPPIDYGDGALRYSGVVDYTGGDGARRHAEYIADLRCASAVCYADSVSVWAVREAD